MRKKITALVLTVLAVTIPVSGLFAFCNYPRASPRSSYQLLIDNIVGYTYANGVSMSVLTPGHGQLAKIQIFVVSQHAGNSTMVLSYAVNFTGNEVTSSTYTVGQTIIIHRIYQDGYAETTNGSIPLTQRMLVAAGIPSLPSTGPPQLNAFFIPVQQWVPLPQAQGAQGPQVVQNAQRISSYDLAWLNVAMPLIALIASAMILIRGFSKAPKETE
jgi:hypothetical protein